MPAAPPLYDLVLMLDTSAEDARRAEIVTSVEEAVTRGGEIVNRQDWGARAMAYEIDHRKDAEYHLLQFHGTAELLAELERTLRITDEVVRFRIIKLAPGTPPPPEQRPEPRPAGAQADEPREAAPAESGGEGPGPVAAEDAEPPAEAAEPTPAEPAAEAAEPAAAEPAEPAAAAPAPAEGTDSPEADPASVGGPADA